MPYMNFEELKMDKRCTKNAVVFCNNYRASVNHFCQLHGLVMPYTNLLNTTTVHIHYCWKLEGSFLNSILCITYAVLMANRTSLQRYAGI